MTSFAVMGAGMMGRVVAKDLATSEPEANVVLFDRSAELLDKASRWIGSGRLRTEVIDADDVDSLARAMRGHDACVGALPHGLSLALVDCAIASGTSLVDLVGEAPETRQRRDAKAREAGCLVVPGCGVAPGISNFCVGRGMELLDETENAVIYVGGIPRTREPPLFYQTVYLLESVFNAYRRRATITRDGRLVEVEPLSGLEELVFDEPIGTLEAFYTDGLGSLPYTVGEAVTGELSEKTLRYPGHVERIRVLQECGLFDQEPVTVGEVSVSPADVLLKVLEDKLQLGPEGDILAMRIVVEGRKSGAPARHEFELVDFFDPETGFTAMARTTGFAASGTARRIARREIEEKGVVFPEQIYLGERFESMLAELAGKGVKIVHRQS